MSRTGQADAIPANAEFTARVTMAHFSSLPTTLKVVYPGINIEAEGELACRSQVRARSMFGMEAMAGALEVVEMGPVRAPVPLKEIGFVLGLVLATLLRV